MAVTIIYGADSELDKRHAECFAAAHPCRLIPVEGAEHNAAAVIKEPPC
jgi:hypothetical protein